MSLRLSRSRLKLSLTTDLKSKSTLIKSKRLQIQSLWHKRSHRHGMISKNGCKIKSLWKIHQWKNNSNSVRKNWSKEQNFWYQFIRICLKLNTLKNFWWNTLLKRLWRDWMSSVFSRKWMRFRKNSISFKNMVMLMRRIRRVSSILALLSRVSGRIRMIWQTIWFWNIMLFIKKQRWKIMAREKNT